MGTYSEPVAVDLPCRKCGKKEVQEETWDSFDEAYTDYKYTCTNPDCKHYWWVDGIDS